MEQRRSVTERGVKMWRRLAVMIFAFVSSSPVFSQPDSLNSGVIKVRKDSARAAYYVRTEYDYNRFKRPGMQEDPLELPVPPLPDTVDYFRGITSPDADDTAALMRLARTRPAAFNMTAYLGKKCRFAFAPGDETKLDSARFEFVVNDSGCATLVFIPWYEGEVAPSRFATSVIAAFDPLWLWHPAFVTSYAIPYKMPCAVIYTIYAYDAAIDDRLRNQKKK
jgi:hypothetical protein